MAVRSWSEEELLNLIRCFPDYPTKGVLFRDLTTLFKNGEAFKYVVKALADRFRGEAIDLVAGVEARGFILAGAVAAELGAGLIPIRKAGKLPGDVVRREYQLEYGVNVLEIHRDAVRPGDRVLIVDDLLATGGTSKISAQMVEELGGVVVALAFVIELTALKGREVLKGYRVYSLIKDPR